MLLVGFPWGPRSDGLQALNNWGLVLQELSTMAADHERAQLVRQSVQKFRQAICLRPEFDRACYNLGTVYYSHAHTLSSAAAAQLSSQLTKVCVARHLPCLAGLFMLGTLLGSG